jgi:hypothetical protein
MTRGRRQVGPERELDGQSWTELEQTQGRSEIEHEQAARPDPDESEGGPAYDVDTIKNGGAGMNGRWRNVMTGMTTLLVVGLMAACGQDEATAGEDVGLDGRAAQDAFFEELASRCGDEYPGRAIIAPESDDTFHPAYLGMHIAECDDREIRIVFPVDEDRSRTWVIERSDEGLLFTHEHAREDGTLYENSGWGGWATDRGTALFQHFPDHRWTPDRGPEEERSVWRLRIDPVNGQFVYYLDRGLRPAYRLVFHMGQSQLVEEHGIGG